MNRYDISRTITDPVNARKFNELNAYKKGLKRLKSREKAVRIPTNQTPIKKGAASRINNGRTTVPPGKNHGRTNPKFTHRNNHKFTTRVRPIITVSLR